MKKLLLFTAFFFSSLMQAASVAQVHSDLAAAAEEQIEGQPGRPSLEQQFAARAARLAAERLQKEKADKEQVEQRREHEPLAPENNGNGVAGSVEGVSPEERGALFTSEVPEDLLPGKWDSFLGDDVEAITTDTFEALRKAQHDNGHALILVRVFDCLRPYYYDANAFHAMLNNGGRLLNPQEPRTDLRILARDNQIHYFECKVGTKKLAYKCSYHALVAAIRKERNLAAYFRQHGYALPNVSALEPAVEAQDDAAARWERYLERLEQVQREIDRRQNLVIPVYRIDPAPAAQVAPAPVPDQAAVLRERRKEIGKWFLRIAFPLVLAFGHGVLNNWLARRAGCGLQRWRFYQAPLREWVTGAVARTILLAWGEHIRKKFVEATRFRPGEEDAKGKWFGRGVGLLYLCMLAGFSQEGGEVIPLGKYGPGWRSLANVGTAEKENLLQNNLSMQIFLAETLGLGIAGVGFMGVGLFRALFVP